MKLIKLSILGCFLIIIVYYFYGLKKSSPKDIYVERLVYSKKSNKLFTGKIEYKGEKSTSTVNFCNGMPCNIWSEVDNYGGIIQQGEYLNKMLLSKKTTEEIGTDTFYLDYWHEGHLLEGEYPPFLVVGILKPTFFFTFNQTYYNDYIDSLAHNVFNDTYDDIKYDELEIIFLNQIYDATKHIYKTYKIKNNELVNKNKSYYRTN